MPRDGLADGDADAGAVREPLALPDPLTLPALLARNRAQAGDEPVLVTDDRSITHAQLDDESRAVARRLVAAGVGKASV